MVSLPASPALPVENGRPAKENQRNQAPAIRRQRRRTKRLSENLSGLLAAVASPCPLWPSARLATTRKQLRPARTTRGMPDGSDECEQPKSPRTPGLSPRRSDPWRRADRSPYHSPRLPSLLKAKRRAPDHADFFLSALRRLIRLPLASCRRTPDPALRRDSESIPAW